MGGSTDDTVAPSDTLTSETQPSADPRLDQLEKSVKSHEESIRSLMQQMEQMRQSQSAIVPASSGDSGNLRNDVEEVIKAMKRDISQQRETVSDFNAKMPNLMSEVNSMKTDLGYLKGADVASLKGEVEGLADKLYRMQIEFRTTSLTDKAINNQNISLTSGGNSQSIGVEDLGKQIGAAVDSALSRGGAKSPLQFEELRRECATMEQRWYSQLAELRQEIEIKTKNLHDAMETTALKAGYLAVSASECSIEEKNMLYQTLRSKEDSILLKSQMGNMLTAPPTNTYPALTQYGGGGGLDEFAITLQQIPGVKLGLSVNGEDGQSLIVERINDGLVTRHNMENPAHAVKEGDMIVEVNGRRGAPKDLIDTLQAGVGQILSLVFKKCGEAFVQLMVPEGQSLGLQVDSDGTALTITRIHPGVMSSWNEANPGAAVRPGDRIVAVNGQRGNARALLEETKRKGALTLSVVRVK